MFDFTIPCSLCIHLRQAKFSGVMISNARNHVITYIPIYMVPTRVNSTRNIYNVDSDTHHSVK